MDDDVLRLPRGLMHCHALYIVKKHTLCISGKLPEKNEFPEELGI